MSWGAAAVLAVDFCRSAWRSLFRPDVTLRSADWGFVYTLQDAESPDLFKIGVTKRGPLIRSFEVSRDVCGGREFLYVASLHMPFKAAVEAETHRLLSRYNEISERGQEWFRLRGRRTAVAVMNRASRTVRRVAKLRRRWSREADQDWKGISTLKLFMVRSRPRARS